jgi:FMN phosphatase YigB (HAD superfamily)
VAIRFVCLDWGGTLMAEDGPPGLPMADWPEVHVVPGARELLATLAPRYPLGVATNAAVSRRIDVERALARGGLRGFITHFFCASEIGARKDSAAFWQAVTRSLDCRPQEIAMVGDSLAQDVLGPAAFGVRTFWFNPQALPAPPGVADLRRLPDLPAALDALAR